MLDGILLAVLVAFGLLSWALVWLCDMLMREKQ